MPIPGTVYLVGAGPGDPGLITLKGLHCLQRADLVLYDGLVNPLLLRHTKATAIRTCRAETALRDRLPQSEVNQRLVDAAKSGQTVVRLKGGDPLIFGRGGEEAAALSAAGIPFEIVPGITAATAAGAYVGLSLTHRDWSSQLAFVTGHEDPGKPESAVDYNLLAEFRGTLVFYMGLHRLEQIAATLMQHGKSGDTNCCVVSRATTPNQRVVESTLADIATKVRAAELPAPSLFLVGDVLQQRRTMNWFERLPLFGQRIGITRPEGQADSALTRCLGLGAEPVQMPTIRIDPPEDWENVDAAIARLGEFDWLIFTSVNGVESLLTRLWETGGDGRLLAGLRIACIGSATAERLAAFRLRADLVPESFRAEALAEALQSQVAGKRLLWARASRGRDVLPEFLTQAGAKFEQVVVYQNRDVKSLPAETLERIETGRLDWIGLSSPSIARNLRSLLTDAAIARILDGSVKLASISPVTTAAAIDVGLPIAAEATTYTWDGIFAAIRDAAS